DWPGNAWTHTFMGSSTTPSGFPWNVVVWAPKCISQSLSIAFTGECPSTCTLFSVTTTDCDHVCRFASGTENSLAAVALLEVRWAAVAVAFGGCVAGPSKPKATGTAAAIEALTPRFFVAIGRTSLRCRLWLFGRGVRGRLAHQIPP